MTSVSCWIGIDSRSPASIYLASDSQITWPGHLTWDEGRKLFACHNHPDLLAYVGQVLFPSQVLSRICDLADAGLLFDAEMEPERKQRVVFDAVINQFGGFPVDRERPFTVVYCTRKSSGMESQFYVATLSWQPHNQWHEEIVKIPEVSGIVGAWGSGQSAVDKWNKRWMNTNQGGRTSRSVFSAFYDALASRDDSSTGGSPRFVGLYRKNAGKTFGVVYGGARYILGTQLQDPSYATSVEWRNVLFERCDAITMQKLGDAQSHRRPHGLGNSV